MKKMNGVTDWLLPSHRNISEVCLVKHIYLDHAATTPLLPEVLESMLPYFTEYYGNPSSSHHDGRSAKKAVDTAREQIASALKCQPEQIIFTSCGSMANNLAVLSTIRNLPANAKLFTTPIEHSSLLAPMQLYADRCIFGKVDRYGYLQTMPEQDTAFASIQYANNELGSIQDVQKIVKYCKQNRIILHADAVQAFGQIPIDLSKDAPDLVSISAHKFSGPKGIGALIAKQPGKLSPLIYGNNRNTPVAGTENTAAIVGMGKAAELAAKNLTVNIAHKHHLQQLLKEHLLKSIPNLIILTPETKTLPGILSVCIPGVNSEGLLSALDLKGVSVSAGSACHAGEKTASHVMTAIGLSENLLHSVIRFSIGIQNTEEEIIQAADIFCTLTNNLLHLSL